MSRKSDKPKPVSVYVRCRPRNATEKAAGSHSVIDCTKKEVTVKHANSTINKKYTFDHVYGTESSQVDVYKGMCLVTCEHVLYHAMKTDCTSPFNKLYKKKSFPS